jgi:hypothetical protein
MGKLLSQLLGVINFAYDLCFTHVMVRWEGILERYTLQCQILTSSIVLPWRAKKHFLGHKNDLGSTTICANMKVQNNTVGLGGRPLVSIWNMCRASKNHKIV